MIGASNGAGNYGDVRARLRPRFLFMWPNARISVMGGEQAADVLTIVKLEQLERAGAELSAAEVEKIQAPIREQYEREGNPVLRHRAALGRRRDGPLETRETLALALSASLNAPIPDSRFGLFRM